MGRLFTAASGHRIHVGSTAGLAGFNLTFGTIAFCVRFAAVTAGQNQALLSTNLDAGAHVWVGHSDPGGGLGWWDGSNSSTIGPPATATPLIVVFTKATGSTTAVMHVYQFSTGAWTHTVGTGNSGNGATTTAVTIGASMNSSTDPFNGEMFEIAAWPGYAMTNRECEELTRPGWGRLNPGLWDFWDTSRDNSDMYTIGRYRVSQTARTGAGRGIVIPPPGWGSSPVRHRR